MRRLAEVLRGVLAYHAFLLCTFVSIDFIGELYGSGNAAELSASSVGPDHSACERFRKQPGSCRENGIQFVLEPRIERRAHQDQGDGERQSRGYGAGSPRAVTGSIPSPSAPIPFCACSSALPPKAAIDTIVTRVGTSSASAIPMMMLPSTFTHGSNSRTNSQPTARPPRNHRAIRRYR